MKRKALTALAAVGIIAAGVIIIELIIRTLWVCYYAGIPM